MNDAAHARRRPGWDGPETARATGSGAALREAIRRAGLSYEAVAHRLGLKGRSSVAQWCSGSIAVPSAYHAALRQMLRASHLFPESAASPGDRADDDLLPALLRSFASMPVLPVDLVERASWDVWNLYVHRADWHTAGRYVAVLQESIASWRHRLGFTTRRLERIRWASAHGQLRSALYTCEWEVVEQLSAAARRDIYRSRWLNVLDHSEQALILNTLSLAEFFLKARFRRVASHSGSGRRLSILRQALTVALNHLGEADRRLRLPQPPSLPPASALRLEIARLLLEATRTSMIYEAREDSAAASTLVSLADRAADMAKTAANEAAISFAAPDAASLSPEYREYLIQSIFPRIELECRYNAAVIGALHTRLPSKERALIAASTACLEEMVGQVPDNFEWRAELRVVELFHIFQQVVHGPASIPRDLSLQMRYVLADLREDLARNELIGLARSAASLEVLLDVSLARLPDTIPAEREERLQSAAELVDWLDASAQSHPDTPTGLIAEWDRAALDLLDGVREASTVRDLVDIYCRLRDYGGDRLSSQAAAMLARIAHGEFGVRAAAAIPASLRETLPPSSASNAGVDNFVLVLSPLLYPMMPINFLRPQGYDAPSPEFWSEKLPLSESSA